MINKKKKKMINTWMLLHLCKYSIKKKTISMIQADWDKEEESLNYKLAFLIYRKKLK